LSWGQPQSVAPAQAQSAVLRVTSPQQNQRQTANFVTVRYELQNTTSAPASSPNFKVQLDGGDPVTTTSTEQTFTGLTPGQHVITVQLVDANGTQIPDSQTQVQFVVVPTPQNGGAAGPQGTGNQPATPTPQVSQHNGGNVSPDVPVAGAVPPNSNVLPIVSLVGFGVLVSGIVSAIKTHA
jgi:hypothetical protein